MQSLLSLPYLGFLDMNDRAYVATRKLLLSRANPYFSVGANFSGIGYACLELFSSDLTSSLRL
jgi:meiotically up-regulated gene 157 (Mug157) protein